MPPQSTASTPTSSAAKSLFLVVLGLGLGLLLSQASLVASVLQPEHALMILLAAVWYFAALGSVIYSMAFFERLAGVNFRTDFQKFQHKEMYYAARFIGHVILAVVIFGPAL